MWNYEKRLQFPVNITRPNAKIAQIIISQYDQMERRPHRSVICHRGIVCHIIK